MAHLFVASIARLIRSSLGWLFVILALVGCGAPDLQAVPGATVAPPTPLNPTAPMSSPARTATAPRTAATPIATKQVDDARDEGREARAPRSPTPIPPTPVPPTVTPIPVAIQPPPGDAVTLSAEQDGYRLEAHVGAVGAIRWDAHTPAQLHVEWLHEPDAGQSFWGYQVEPDSGEFSPEMGGGFHIQASTEPDRPLNVYLLDAGAGQWHTIFSLDPAVPQWADPADRRWDFDGVGGTVTTHWVGAHQVVLALTPLSLHYDDVLVGWGKLLLVDVRAHQVRVLAEQGQLVAAFPNGSLLLRRGWIDGPVQLIAPPYDEPPATLANSGPWSTNWLLSPDLRRVAWLEWTPPVRGDWSRQLPGRCCSGDPPPSTSAIVFWDRATGRLQRFPVSGIAWHINLDLRWNLEGSGVRFVGVPSAGPDTIAEFEIDLHGRQTLLISAAGEYWIRLVAEGSDRSRYVALASGVAGEKLIRRYADGREEVVRVKDPASRQFRGSSILAWDVDARGRLVERFDDGTIVVQDLSTGTTARAVFPPEAELSPDGRWVAYRIDMTVYLRPL
jgi:hypothetical protein